MWTHKIEFYIKASADCCFDVNYLRGSPEEMNKAADVIVATLLPLYPTATYITYKIYSRYERTVDGAAAGDKPVG